MRVSIGLINQSTLKVFLSTPFIPQSWEPVSKIPKNIFTLERN
jgi:hypothetical protein